MTDLETVRRYFAEEVRAVSSIRSETLVRAFAKVPREHFLGPGPWRTFGPLGYQTTEDDDPRHIYHNVPVALDASRNLNNGQPSFLAMLIDALDVREGDQVVHLGSGVGYYTAIIAEIVGPSGRILALEFDSDLARRAQANLAGYPQVEVESVDGSKQSVGSSDAILVNAGATHPLPAWLDSLRPNGRLVLPLTVESRDEGPIGMGMSMVPHGIGTGRVLKVCRSDEAYAAAFVSRVQIFHCIGARSDRANALLESALRSGGAESVQSLRRDLHGHTDDCWLHGDGYCLSTSPPVAY